MNLYVYITAIVLAEIGLPTADTYSNINLGVTLVMSDHPRWALLVFFPIIAKTFFMLFSCRNIENSNWMFYTPLVFLQIYPQFCVVRIMFQWLAKNVIKEKDFWREFNGLAGSIGFLHVLQSVPQGFIQTGFYAVSHILPTKIEKFCFNEKNKSCNVFDNCTTVVRNLETCPDDFSYQNTFCNKIQFEPYKYNSFEEVYNCKEMVQNCTELFESCLLPFNECITECKTTLHDRIMSLVKQGLLDSDIRSAIMNQRKHFLSEEFGATIEDLKSIQLDLLYASNYSVFLMTYIISVIASMYGITKYFRLSYSRHCDTFAKPSISVTGNFDGEFVNQGLDYVLYGMTCIISGIYLAGKGLVLSRLMWIDENTMGTNVALWLGFCMVPSLMFTLFITLRWTCIKSENHQILGKDIYKSWMPKLFAKDPAIFGIPLVSPFMYKVKTIGCNRKEFINDQKMMHVESEVAFFALSYHLSYINNAITILFASIGLITVGHLESDFVFIVSGSLFVITSVLVFLIRKRDCNGNTRCFEHGKLKSNCTDCAGVFGLRVKDYQKVEVCKAHELPDCSFCESFLSMGNTTDGELNEDQKNMKKETEVSESYPVDENF